MMSITPARDKGSLQDEEINNDRAEHKRTNFDCNFRDVSLDGKPTFNNLARRFKYWLVLTDCDGFRADTLKHVSMGHGRNVCGTIKEFAVNLGKGDVFLVGKVGGPKENARRYSEVLAGNMDATLDTGNPGMLTAVAKGLEAPLEFFSLRDEWDYAFGSHRRLGEMHVTVLDDHDHVAGDRVRFASDAASDHQVVAGVAIQLFSLVIPLIYYGTEQAFAGPEESLRNQFLPDYDQKEDKYPREAMFGPDHPRQSGAAGLAPGVAGPDGSLPGFGPFSTAGQRCFDPDVAPYIRIAALNKVQTQYPKLRVGRQELRQISNFGASFATPGAGELTARSRLLDDDEALCVINGHGKEECGGDVLVDATVNGGSSSQFVVIANSAQAATAAYTGAHPIGQSLSVRRRGGSRFVESRDIDPSEVLVCINRT